jgi:hypothetical protein
MFRTLAVMPAKAGIHAGWLGGAKTLAFAMRFEAHPSAIVDARFRGHDEVEGDTPWLTGCRVLPTFPGRQWALSGMTAPPH